MKIDFSTQQVNLNNQGILGSDKDNNDSVSFSDFLNGAIQQVSDLQNQSDQLNEDFALGKTDNIHQVMIAAEKADMALQFTVQIRNKILDAYSEIMRMPV